jgi:hypothetical protein
MAYITLRNMWEKCNKNKKIYIKYRYAFGWNIEGMFENHM